MTHAGYGCRRLGEHMNLYLHIPFCAARCTYCDFNTYAGLSRHLGDYMQSLRAEIHAVAQAGRDHQHDRFKIDTLFIGGGTPSLVPLEEYRLLKSGLSESFHLKDGMEWSLEANPGTLSLSYLKGLRDLGVNRLSLGVQSAQQEELTLLGRIHTFPDARHAFHDARQAGFDNINLDLIYGLPGQPLSAWQESLGKALELQPDHLSLYALSVESGTPLHARVAGGGLPEPDDDLAADMYAWAENILATSGYAHYEISNWARLQEDEPASTLTPQHVCRHNVHIWRNQFYLGFGAGAHGYAANVRYNNVRHPLDYIAALRREKRGDSYPCSAAAVEALPVSPEQAMADSMILGLRLLQEGVSFQAFLEQHGKPFEELYASILADYRNLDLLEVLDDRVRLTPRAHFIANQVMQAFLPS